VSDVTYVRTGHSFSYVAFVSDAFARRVVGWQTDLAPQRGRWSRIEDLELATLEWVWWFNNHRLLGPLGHVPPAEFEQMHHTRQTAQSEPLALKSTSLR
jgi:transposase InsO family protein